MIYFIQRGVDGPIKIGFTESNIEDRTRSIQTSCPEKLLLLGHVNGTIGQEKMLHKILKEDKLRGEWFRPSQSVLNYISETLNGKIIKELPRKYNKEDTKILKKLEQYINMKGISIAQAATEIGCTRQYLYMLINGLVPGKVVAMRIQEWSSGVIKAVELMGMEK